jgi:Zn-dependent protease
MNLTFRHSEIKDLLIAWAVLSVAFTIFFFRGPFRALASGAPSAAAVNALAVGLVVSSLTAGVGFLLHELAHKVVAVHYGQVAAFKADYSMLFLAVMSAVIGFLFAAPGAVYHRGFVTEREQGLIALAGPAVNVALLVAFAPLYFLGGGIVAQIGALGLLINAILAAFNMIPFGPLDGKKVLRWSKPVFVATAVPILGLAALLLFGGVVGLTV